MANRARDGFAQARDSRSVGAPTNCPAGPVQGCPCPPIAIFGAMPQAFPPGSNREGFQPQQVRGQFVFNAHCALDSR